MKHLILLFVGTLLLVTLTASHGTVAVEQRLTTIAKKTEKERVYFLKRNLYKAYEINKTVCDWFKYKVAKTKLTEEQRKDYQGIITGLQVKMMNMSKFSQNIDSGEHDMSDVNADLKRIIALLPSSPELALFFGYAVDVADLTSREYPRLPIHPDFKHCQDFAATIYDDCTCAAFVKAKCNGAASLNADSDLFDNFEALSCLINAAELERECVRVHHPESPTHTFVAPAANQCKTAEADCFEPEYPAGVPQIPQHSIPELY